MVSYHSGNSDNQTWQWNLCQAYKWLSEGAPRCGWNAKLLDTSQVFRSEGLTV
jgi:hypothetical protein